MENFSLSLDDIKSNQSLPLKSLYLPDGIFMQRLDYSVEAHHCCSIYSVEVHHFSCQTLRLKDYITDEFVEEFGIKISNHLATVEVRVLPMPMVCI